MGELLLRMIGDFLGSAILVVLVLGVLLVFAAIRLLPPILALLRLGFGGFLRFSFRLYRLLLGCLGQGMRVNLLAGLPRLVGCLLLSLGLGWLGLTLIGWPDTGWGIGLASLHGLWVGLAWERLETPQGLFLGERTE